MLLDKQKTMPYIGIFKMPTGEEVIAKVTADTDTYYSVKNPLCMVASQKGYQFAPYLLMADPEKPINIPKPIITADPVAELAGQYESVVSGIALPQKSSIIT
jgi:hypothetical protein